MILRQNKLWVKLQEAQHSTDYGIIVDSKSDNYVDYGILLQDQECFEETKPEVSYKLTEGMRIAYSKNMMTPLNETEGIIDFKNVIGWEE